MSPRKPRAEPLPKRGPRPPERALTPKEAEARLRVRVDRLRADLRKVEEGEVVQYVGPSTPAIIESLLMENARHGKILEAWLRERDCYWDGTRVKKIQGTGPKGSGNKRHLLRLDVERVLRHLSDVDGVPWSARGKPTNAFLARIRAVLSGRRDPADLTDAKLRWQVNNIMGQDLADKLPEPHLAQVVAELDAALVRGLGWERDPPLEPPPTSPPPAKRTRKKKM